MTRPLAPLAAVLLAAGFAQQIFISRSASAVVDEPAHLTAGYLSLSRFDLSINREHPPLLKALAALPLLPLRPVLPALEAGGPAPGSEDFEFDYARRFLYRANDADRLLRAARLPMMLLTLGLGAVVLLWAREIAGDAAGLAALALYVFEPNVLAHGALVTTDLGSAAFCVAFLWGLRRAVRSRPGEAALGRFALCGLLLGLALLSKFSALLLIPVGAILAAADRLSSRSPREATDAAVPGCAGGPRPAILARPLGAAVLVLGTAWLVLEAGYGFQGLPLPRLYLEGMELARLKNATVEGPTYLMGAISRDGFWSYYLVALLVKTPLPLLLLAALGTASSLRDRRALREAVWVLGPAAAWLAAMTILTRAQIGLRYVLPVTPLLCIAGGAGAASLLRRALAGGGVRPDPPSTDNGARRAIKGSRRILGAALVGVLMAWHVGAALRIHPHPLAYFNEAAGGPDRGWRWLVDSNLDWGQDLIGLRDWLEDRDDPAVNLYYFGTADPDYYAIRRHSPAAPQPGLFAVSATHLAGVYLPDPDYLAAFRSLPPVARIGHSILVFRLDSVPERLTRPAVSSGWRRHEPG